MDSPVKADLKITVPEDTIRDQSKNLSNLISPFVEGMGWIGDAVRLARLDTVEKTIRKASKICEENNIPMNGLPIKFMIPFIEKCSYEDVESEMIDRWACLLASSVESKDIHTAFIDILSQISAKEAQLLKIIWQKKPLSQVNQLELFLHQSESIGFGILNKPYNEGPKYGILLNSSSFRNGEFPDDDGVRERNIKSLQILERQNLLRTSSLSTIDVNGQQTIEIYASLTPLGYAFTKACEKYN